jgi:hypothetical protein
VHDEIGFLGVRRNARRESASFWIIDDQTNNISALLVTQTELLGALLVVVDLLGVHEPPS